MASQLDIIQVSADYCMDGAYMSNHNFANNHSGIGGDVSNVLFETNSFERNIQTRASEATRSLYDKTKTRAMHQKNKDSISSKGGSKTYASGQPQQAAVLKNLVRKRQNSR